MTPQELKDQEIDRRMRIFANLLLDRIEEDMRKEDLQSLKNNSNVKSDGNNERTL